ncbi:MAG: hypothetical protein IPL55_07685 [Saprospiraceae bacterium]|nr:hypothetical protein [Saprospiraceae bacterium]
MVNLSSILGLNNLDCDVPGQDYLVFEYSINNGFSWLPLNAEQPNVICPPANGIFSGSTYTFTSPQFNGTSVKFRMLFGMQAVNEGLRINSLQLFDQPDPDVNQPADQIACSGDQISTIFSGTGSSYTWTNDNTSIGLGASGTGNINFIASNVASTQIGVITVTPQGSCAGTSKMFFITIKPSQIPTFIQVPPICDGGLFVLPTTSNNGINGTWTPTINNTITTTYTFTPDPVFTQPCANLAMMTVVVNENNGCLGGLAINFTNVCDFISVNGTTVGACPENFTVAGCALNYSTNPIVWYSFTPPAGTTTLEIENITTNAFLSIFNSCPAGPATISGGGCLSGAGTNGTPIPVTTGTTYYLAIGINGAPGNVNFEIKYNISIPNNNPCIGGFVPIVLSNGTPLSGQNNACATADNNCAAGVVSNTLWYTLTLSAPFDRITINVTGLTSPSIAIYTQANPCNQTAANEVCNGDGVADFNCLLRVLTLSWWVVLPPMHEISLLQLLREITPVQ